MVIADLGAGTGFYSIPAAKMAPKGKVYAIEIIPDMVTTIRNKTKEAHLSNVDCLVGDIEKVGGTKLADATADRVIASNVLFQVEHKESFADEIKRILRPGGKLLLVDWTAGGLMGPREEFVVAPEAARELFGKKGLVFEREIDPGEYHYGLIFRKE